MTLVRKCYVDLQIYSYPVHPLTYTLYLGLKRIVIFVLEYSVFRIFFMEKLVSYDLYNNALEENIFMCDQAL